MPGPTPKPAALRQRTNRVSTAASLTPSPPRRRHPKLPADREWQPETRVWWHNLWRSPMAAEYVQSDTDGLLRLAVLVEAFWRAPTTALAAEIRLQGQCFGLTPIDRRRLQWDVRRPEAPSAEPVLRPPVLAEDPRKLLSVVS